MRSWFAKLRSRGLATQSAVLALPVLAVYAAVAPVAAAISGLPGLAAAAVAAGLCLAGAGLALVACRCFRHSNRAWQEVLIGMLLRMGVPLFSALVIQFQGGRLAKAGVLIYLVVFYPVTLFIQTALSLPSDSRSRWQSDVSEKVIL